MKQLHKILTNTNWATVSNAINNNNDALYVAVTTLENAAFKHKGYFKNEALLYSMYPIAEEGSQAFVYNSSNPTSAPYDIYEWVNGGWQDSGINGGNVNVNLDSKQDTLVGYSESVSGGKATQVAIQGDKIALSGKVSLGNVDNMESAILMSSSQAGAAIAKANTLEQSMNAIKSPIKPIQLNSQGKLELNIGKGLYVEDGKLCTTGASGGGGGGGTTYSEGQGIIIQDDKISVAYDIDTLRVNDCGGLTVNYGEGLAIKDGKLSALASVTAGNGLVKKGEELSVNISTGLQYGGDGELAVKTGKGLSVDNTGTINANIDNSTIATNSAGAMYVAKGMLAGQGLKVSLDRLAVNYGNGLTISNRALVVKYGTGLAVDSCGRLYGTAQGGKTYVGGQAVNVNGNEINVKYDGVTLSTKDTADNSLHVMLGSGLIQGTSGIDVAVGSGLAIGSDNQIYCTVDGGTTYTAGDGIYISNGKISFKLGTSLESVCGYIQVAISSGLEYDPYNEYKIRVKAGDGITIPNTGEVKVSLGSGLTFGEFGAINICDSVLADIGNLKDSKQDKLTFGDEFMSCNNSVSLNYDFLIPVLVGDGLERKNCGLAIKHGTGLTIDRCGNLSINHYGIMNPTGGLTYSDGLGVNARDGIKVDACAVVIDYGTGLSLSDNKIYVDTSKIAGAGMDFENGTKKLVIGTEAAKILAGSGLKQVGQQLAVDAENLSVNQATNASTATRTRFLETKHMIGDEWYGNNYMAYIQWEESIAKLKVDGYQTKVDIANRATADANGNNIADTYLKSVGASGDGISISGGKIAVKYCDGLQITNGSLAIATGDGLHIKDNTLAINPSNGLGFTIDGLLKLKLHEKSGLQATSAGLGVNAGVALSTSDGKLNVQYGTGLTISNAKLVVDPYSLLTTGGGLCVDEGGLNIMVGNGLTIADCSVAVNYGTGLSVNSSKIYVDTSKIAGAGMDFENGTKKLVIGTEAAKILAGSGLKQVGQQLAVDAENLSVNQATNASTATRTRFLETKHMIGDEWYGNNYMAYIQWEESIAKLKVDNYETKVDIAKKAEATLRFKRVVSRVDSNPLDCNAYKEGIIYNYADPRYWQNAPSGMGYGLVLSLSESESNHLMGQLAWDVNHASTTDTTRNLWWRASDDGTLTEAKWHQIAFMDAVPSVRLLYARHDYQYYVVLLCKYGVGMTHTSHRLTGKLYSEDDGSRRYVAADVDIFVSDWADGIDTYLRFDTYGINEMDVVTCNYEGVKYLAVRIQGDQAKKVYFEGTSNNMLLTPIQYYTTNTNIVNNAEIYGSIEVVNVSQPSSNGNKYALVSDTVARATADSCGRVFAATYAEHFTPTNGLAINEYRTLYLPNLTASVINGAVDRSKNGAQRVLELSCGAIEIKLSTGLGIDEKGYLYVKG